MARLTARTMACGSWPSSSGSMRPTPRIGDHGRGGHHNLYNAPPESSQRRSYGDHPWSGGQIRERCSSVLLARANGIARSQILRSLTTPRLGCLALRIRNGSDDPSKGVHDLIYRRVSAKLQLGEDQIVARDDLIRATLGGDKCDVTDVMLVLAEYCLNHAHGTVGVVSGCAVFNG